MLQQCLAVKRIGWTPSWKTKGVDCKQLVFQGGVLNLGSVCIMV